jgi:hypothetical protein
MHRTRHKSQPSWKIGVKFVTDVDKSGFIKTAEPLQDKIAAVWDRCDEDLQACRSVT